MSRVLYAVLPVSLLLLPYLFFWAFDGADFYFGKETGAAEHITVGLLAIAIFVCARRLLRWSGIKGGPFGGATVAWIAIYLLGCVYFLGEEISWGQHMVGWGTPDAWGEINDQDETNLHNISGLFDQLPRLILTLGIVFGGIVFPVVRRRRTRSEGARSFWDHFMPGCNCVPGGVCVLAIGILSAISEASDAPWLDIEAGEVKESLIAAFLVIYIVDFTGRLCAAPARQVVG